MTLETNSFVAGMVGAPIITVTRNDGAWKVLVAQDGHRGEDYFVIATGQKRNTEGLPARGLSAGSSRNDH
jgi:NADPH-dependent 2,4-dienoyl-CoA reductase/sulfur reductase-like enzyme